MAALWHATMCCMQPASPMSWPPFPLGLRSVPMGHHLCNLSHDHEHLWVPCNACTVHHPSWCLKLSFARMLIPYAFNSIHRRGQRLHTCMCYLLSASCANRCNLTWCCGCVQFVVLVFLKTRTPTLLLLLLNYMRLFRLLRLIRFMGVSFCTY